MQWIALNLKSKWDIIARKGLELQITEYGQTPKQIFSKPHPKRFTDNLSDDFIKENPSFPTTKHINFSEKDIELVQNIDENLLGSMQINIKINGKSKSDNFLF